MRIGCHWVLLFLLLLMAANRRCCAQGNSNAVATDPLPDPDQLMQRAQENQNKIAEELERYECRVNDQWVELDPKGNIKRTKTEIDDQFYVNGVAIRRVLSKDGKDLTSEETDKENSRVMKETATYSNRAAAQKELNKYQQQMEEVLAAVILTNGRRENENGRSILQYDIVPNRTIQARNLIQHFVQAMQGRIVIDEKTGEMIDLDLRSTKDVKIGGGILAVLHKGFWMHVHNQVQPDGVWLTDLAEGSGDARAALFFHPRVQFKEITDNCHLYSVTANQVGPARTVK